HVYGGLLTSIMRMVFLLYAEDQGLLPKDAVWVRNYAVAGLHKRLRDDAALNPDTMDQRYGAWAALLALFRIVHNGGGHGAIRLPGRKGQLFDPDAYPFLEGRPAGSRHDPAQKIDAPKVSDGCLYRVLEGLLVLDGERLSYRALDVEQIGSVYEAMMGYVVERMPGRSFAVRLRRKGIPGFIFVDLDEMLAQPAAKRAKWLEEAASCKLTGAATAALEGATTSDEVFAALERRVSEATPRVLPAGALVLQPGEERRRSGSHYTPRELTQPIVRTTLRPILEALGPRPTPKQILDLKVCDPAMGSGAFLVEACRQLAEALVAAWETHGETPEIPPDEDALLHAKRLIAQRCLYGVDKNPFAVNLAKLSLWLVTLARDHPFTFVDHALRHGDSLVGLTRDQIRRFHWDVGSSEPLPLLEGVAAAADTARGHREALEGMGDDDEEGKRAELARADAALAEARLAGDLVVSAFFSGERGKDRAHRLAEMRPMLDRVRDGDPAPAQAVAADLRRGKHVLPPFHWEIEFPEAFGRDKPGFDAIVGNPPFAGKNTVIAGNRAAYPDWLKAVHEESHGNADLVAHFFRRAFGLLSPGGAFGLIATNTVGQGDTRATGLRWICKHGGTIYDATRRRKWPGESAAVVVSVVHVVHGPHPGRALLDGRPVKEITAFLFHTGGHDDPAALMVNAGLSFVGSYVLGMGFTFDDTETDGVATPVAEMRRLIETNPRNREVIFPYIGGEEVNTSPTHAHHRYVINFGERSEEECRRNWPELMAIVEEKVKPERMGNNREGYR
ncbi:MAG: SAM-dependent methyltransferase, partial [Planctomycetes bacterium]|nr:SAM-dependent methyltransferase [Planctomycetota bacterium]